MRHNVSKSICAAITKLSFWKQKNKFVNAKQCFWKQILNFIFACYESLFLTFYICLHFSKFWSKNWLLLATWWNKNHSLFRQQPKVCSEFSPRGTEFDTLGLDWFKTDQSGWLESIHRLSRLIVSPVTLLLKLLPLRLLVTLHLLMSFQVCLSCPFSPERSPEAVPAVMGKSGTASCCRPWTGSGTRTVWSAPAVTAAWAGWGPRFTPAPTSSSAAETTSGEASKRRTWRTWLLAALS